MMIRSCPLIGFIVALAMSLHVQPADGGLMCAVSNADLIAASSLPDEAPQRPRRDWPRPPKKGIVTVPGGGSSSMGASAPGNSPVVPAFALPDVDDGSSSGQLAAGEPGVALAVPFLSGIFRPPRC